MLLDLVINRVHLQETIGLIENLRPPGIIAILDEETKFPKATDLTFLQKCHTNFGKHDQYEQPKLSKTTFIVKHYAGAVSYEVTIVAIRCVSLLSGLSRDLMVTQRVRYR